jgi:hypothetical protein
MSTIYAISNTDQRHSHRGVYVDVSGCFELPVGPFNSREMARAWVLENANRLTELYGLDAAKI